MAGPPPPKKNTPDDLAEVERALSVLKGRHPEHERTQREENERKAQRQARIEAMAAAEHKEQLSKRLKIGGIAGALLVVLVVAAFVFRRELARRGKVEESGDAYRAMGFVVVDTTSRGSPGKLETSADPGCFVATTTDKSPLVVARGDAKGAAKVSGPAPVLFCTCQNEPITVTSEVVEGGGLTLLRIDPAIIGGSRAFAFAPFKPGATAAWDKGCDEGSLDGWIDAKRFPAPQIDDKWLADPTRAALATHAKMLATFDAGVPFAVVDVPKESCLLVTSSASDDKLSLRVKGGTTPVAPTTNAIAWCQPGEWTPVVSREGGGRVAVLALSAPAIGGLVGVRDLAKKTGITLGFAGLPTTEHGWNARQLLLATTIPDGIIKTAALPDMPKDPDARVVALSFGTPNAIVTESAADTYSYCDPPIVEATRESVCIFSGEPILRASGGDAVGAVALAKLPFWLFGLKEANDPVGLKEAASLASLARRLKQERFEPTTIEAMTELPNGVEVLGRMNEDAVVAVGVMPGEPWVVPYTDGPVWTLDGEPRIVPIKPLERVTLTMPMKERELKKLPPREKRRSVVFRRQK
jgi:hypothetical protein